eukprot:scaffold159879_cov48-Attheya_sp.AAC.1
MVMAKKRYGLTALLMASLAVMSNGSESKYTWHYPWNSSPKTETETEDESEDEDEYHHTHDHNVLTEKRAFCDGVFKLESFEYSCVDTKNSWVSEGADFKVYECWSRYGPCREFWHHRVNLCKSFKTTNTNTHVCPYPGQYTVSSSITLPGYDAPVYHNGNAWIRVQMDGPDGPMCHVKVDVKNFFAEYGTMSVSFLSVVVLVSACVMHIQKAKHERDNSHVIEMTKSQIADEAECDVETPVKSRFKLMQDATQEENSDWDHSSVALTPNHNQSQTPTNQGIRASGIKWSRTPDWDSGVKQNLFNKKDPDWDQ